MTRNKITNIEAAEARLAPPAPVQKMSYRVDEAVQVTGLSRSLIYSLMADGTLRFTQVRGVRIIPAESLHALVHPSHGPEAA